MNPIRVLVVDDQPTVRRGLRMRLALEPDIDVVGEAADCASALTLTRLLAPDVVLMDVEMCGPDGIEATCRLNELEDPPAVIILTLHDHPAMRERARTAGAAGFIAKHQIGEALTDAIRGAGGRADGVLRT
jgi:DNA-binding NarL/FixJ family response regulator